MRRFNITVNGKAYDVGVEEMAAGAAPVAVPAAQAAVAAPAAAPAPAVAPPPAPDVAPAPVAAAGSVKVTSPMPGGIWEVKVTAGQQVNMGDTLLILEAMKMENAIPAPAAGTIASVHVSKGDTVDTGALLVTMD